MINLLSKLVIFILNLLNIGGIFEGPSLVAGATAFATILVLVSIYWIFQIDVLSFFAQSGWRLTIFLIGLALQIPSNFFLWILGALIIAAQVFIGKFIDKNRGKKGFLTKVKQLWEEIQKEDDKADTTA